MFPFSSSNRLHQNRLVLNLVLSFPVSRVLGQLVLMEALFQSNVNLTEIMVYNQDFISLVKLKSLRTKTILSLFVLFIYLFIHFQTGRLPPPSNLCQIPMDSTRPLAVLLPNASGMSICSLALVSYLTTVHNEFNQRYQHLVGENAK